MKKFLVMLLAAGIISSVGCRQEGVSYKIHTNGKGKKVVLESYITMNMQQATESDSVFFSSYKNQRPLTFSVQPTLFNNLLTEGLLKMSEGDSATFWVPADSIFKGTLPQFIGKGDRVKYTISILKVQSKKEYNEERLATQSKAIGADKQKIDAYIKNNNLTILRKDNGIAYEIIKQGSGGNPDPEAKVKIIYKTSLLDGNEVESSKGTAVDLDLFRQVRGMKDAISMLSKGGKGKFILPSYLCYGGNKRNDIPPDSPLIYEVELVDFNNDNPDSKLKKQLSPDTRLQLKNPDLKNKLEEVRQQKAKGK